VLSGFCRCKRNRGTSDNRNDRCKNGFYKLHGILRERSVDKTKTRLTRENVLKLQELSARALMSLAGRSE
jgi:hypothetical protein